MSLTLSRSRPQPNPQSVPGDGTPDSGVLVPQADQSPQDFRNSLDKEELLRRVITWFKESRDHFQEWRQEAAECFDYVAGHQWSDDDKKILADQGRPAVTFNRIGPFVDGVSGLEIGNRQMPQYLPRQLGSAGVNELLTSAAQWVRDECDADDEESDMTRDCIICGVGCTQTRMDYDDNPDGVVKIERVDPLEMYPDASSRKPNFAEGRHHCRVKDMPVPVAEQLFPDEETADLHARWAEDQPDATRSPHNARLAPFYRIDQSGQLDREMQQVRMVEVEWWEYVNAFRVRDPSTDRFVRLNEEQAGIYRVRARTMGHQVKLYKDRERRYYRAIVGAKVLRVMRGPDEGGFMYKFMTAKRDRNRGCWYGLVRALRDPQMWANKFFTQALHIVNTNAKGGLLAEADAFADVNEAEESWADADSIVLLNPGGLNKVKQKEIPSFPVQINQMMQTALDAIPATAGVNLEMIAQQTKEQPGVLEMQRKQQGMTVLAYIFNSKRRYQKEQGRLMLWMIITFIADGRLIRIGGPEQAQYVPLVHQDGLTQYDVIVDDAPTSPNMQEKVWSMIVQMFPMLRALPLPPQAMIELMKYAPFPAGLMTKLEQIAQQASQQGSQNPVDAAKAQVMQSQAVRHGAQAELDKARAQHTMAMAQAMPAKTAADQQEQAAKIENLRASAVASLAKAGVDQQSPQLDQAELAVDSLLRHDQQQHEQGMQEQKQAHEQAMLQEKQAHEQMMAALKPPEGEGGGSAPSPPSSMMLGQVPPPHPAHVLAQALNNISESHRQLTRAMQAPKRLVRDNEGRIIGVESHE